MLPQCKGEHDSGSTGDKDIPCGRVTEEPDLKRHSLLYTGLRVSFVFKVEVEQIVTSYH